MKIVTQTSAKICGKQPFSPYTSLELAMDRVGAVVHAPERKMEAGRSHKLKMAA